jgi:hypothetical protein
MSYVTAPADEATGNKYMPKATQTAGQGRTRRTALRRFTHTGRLLAGRPFLIGAHSRGCIGSGFHPALMAPEYLPIFSNDRKHSADSTIATQKLTIAIVFSGSVLVISASRPHLPHASCVNAPPRPVNNTTRTCNLSFHGLHGGCNSYTTHRRPRPRAACAYDSCSCRLHHPRSHPSPAMSRRLSPRTPPPTPPSCPAARCRPRPSASAARGPS